ncbi:hypothetical protein BJX64DRAFT_245641 [Aspergillus heterothallicus]
MPRPSLARSQSSLKQEFAEFRRTIGKLPMNSSLSRKSCPSSRASQRRLRFQTGGASPNQRDPDIRRQLNDQDVPSQTQGTRPVV